MNVAIPQRAIAEKLMFVNYVVCKESANSAKQRYYYIAVRAKQMDSFKQALQEPGFDPEEYGTVLEAGEGEPSALVRERMRIQYGCDGLHPVSPSKEKEQA